MTDHAPDFWHGFYWALGAGAAMLSSFVVVVAVVFLTAIVVGVANGLGDRRKGPWSDGR